jgi:hypothetical protein
MGELGTEAATEVKTIAAETAFAPNRQCRLVSFIMTEMRKEL